MTVLYTNEMQCLQALCIICVHHHADKKWIRHFELWSKIRTCSFRKWSCMNSDHISVFFGYCYCSTKMSHELTASIANYGWCNIWCSDLLMGPKNQQNHKIVIFFKSMNRILYPKNSKNNYCIVHIVVLWITVPCWDLPYHSLLKRNL